MSENVETVAGTSLAISANIPATFDESGYAAVTGWQELGEVTDGGEHGRAYALVTHNPIKTRGTQKFKGSYNEGTKTLQLAEVSADLGQQLAKIASKSDEDYSFRVTYQGGDIDYFQAKVMSYVKQATSVDTIRTATITLELTTGPNGEGIVEVPYIESP